MIWVKFASIASVEALRDVPERHLSFKCVWSFLNLLTGLQYLRYHFFYWCYKTIRALFERVYWGLNFWYFSKKFAKIKIQAICTLYYDICAIKLQNKDFLTWKNVGEVTSICTIHFW